MASVTTTFHDGSQVEVSMCGFESVIGISALMGTHRSLNRIYTQIAGSGFCCSIAQGRQEFLLNSEFHTLSLAFVQAQLILAMQSTGCNAKHDIHQRLCRWLLLCADRANSLAFYMPHEFLADMLGSTRPTVSTAAAILRDRGLIEYTRGRIRILDVKALEANACECYRTVRNHLENPVEFTPATAA